MTTSTSPGLCKLLKRTSPRPFVFPTLRRLWSLIPPVAQQAILACCRGLKPWPLFLTGPAGTGKTCAALWLADNALDAVYWPFAGLAAHLLAARDDERGAAHQEFEISRIIDGRDLAGNLTPNGGLLVLDEIGARQHVSDWQYEILKRILDGRLGKPLLVISNASLADLATIYDDRIASRLAAGTIVTFTGTDRRLGL